MEHGGAHSYLGLDDLPMEMWLEIIRFSPWRTAMSMCLSCKYSYNTLRKYLQHSKIQVDRFEKLHLHGRAETTIVIKNGRVYYHSPFTRRDIECTMPEIIKFSADLQQVLHQKTESNINPATSYNDYVYKYFISDGDYDIKSYLYEPAAERVFQFALNFARSNASRFIPSEIPGRVIITIGEKDERNKSRPYRRRSKRKFRWPFDIKFVLDADGNFEWTAPAYDFRTIYAKKVYEDLKKVITEDRAHLKPLEIQSYDETYSGSSDGYCRAYFEAKFVDKYGKEHLMQRYIVHENNKRIVDLQNYKEKAFKSLINIMDRVLVKTNYQPYLRQLSHGKGRQTLPWFKLFRPPSDLPYDSSKFIHCYS